MKASTKLWVGFRMSRVVAFAIATIMSMVLSVIYAVLLLREWKSYSDAQRAIIIIILVVNGLSAILLYLMIIVRFRLWLDAARVAFLVLVQAGTLSSLPLGATVTFTIFKSSLPCNNLGTVQTCKTVSTVAIFTGWSLTGLLVFYAFCLAIMSHIPQPRPPANPEENLNEKYSERNHISSPSIVSPTSSKTQIVDSSSDIWSDKNRRSFFSSSSSESSQVSWYGSRATTPGTKRASLRSQSVAFTNISGVYRPATPRSIRSPAASSVSGSVYLDTTGSTYDAGRFTPHPFGYYSRPTTPPSPAKARLPYLPNPFKELPSRSGTPGSVASFRSDGILYNAPQNQTRSLIGNPVPRSLLVGDRPALPPAYEAQSEVFPPENMGEGLSPSSLNREVILQRLNNNSTPFTLRPSVRTGDIHGSLKSPDSITVLSQSASIHIPPNRSAGLLSVPRSPSPRNPPPSRGLAHKPKSCRPLYTPTAEPHEPTWSSAIPGEGPRC